MVSKSQIHNRLRVYITYLDDSGTKDKSRKFQMMTAVILHDEKFLQCEAFALAAISSIVPKEKLEQFEECHAYELYLGKGMFDGVDEAWRFSRISTLLKFVEILKIPVIYGAVNKSYLSDQLYGSAHPMDFAFRICARGVSRWVHDNTDGEFALLISDDTQDKQAKETIKASFRSLRDRALFPEFKSGELYNLHDGMYFGDSKDSIGIQLADLCGYFISKHVEKVNDEVAERFYKMVEPQIVNSEVHPLLESV